MTRNGIKEFCNAADKLCGRIGVTYAALKTKKLNAALSLHRDAPALAERMRGILLTELGKKVSKPKKGKRPGFTVSEKEVFGLLLHVLLWVCVAKEAVKHDNPNIALANLNCSFVAIWSIGDYLAIAFEKMMSAQYDAVQKWVDNEKNRAVFNRIIEEGTKKIAAADEPNKQKRRKVAARRTAK